MLLKLGLACLPLAFAFPIFATVAAPPPPAGQSTPAAAPPASTDTNFIDPALVNGDNPQVKQLTDELEKEGIKPQSFMDEHFLFASLIWGSIGTGYLFYAKKQREVAPFIGGVAMIAASFISSWFWMSIVCIALIVGTHWLIRHSD
jgi:hypothetical protein